MAGYSASPLIKKLGIKDGFRCMVRNAPDGYIDWLSPLPETVAFYDGFKKELDFIHIFSQSRKSFLADLVKAKKSMAQKGMIWISWPKKASGVKTDLDENVIRETALKSGLVDIKVCAVSETWSGLKLVIPVKNRL